MWQNVRAHLQLRQSKISLNGPARGARLAFLLALSLCTLARADVLILDDGTRVEGKTHKDGDQWIVIDNTGHETDVPVDRIVSFHVGTGQLGGSAAERLTTLRSSADALTGLSIIIQRYQTFIQQNPGTIESQQAASDLVVWQKRLDQHSTKVGRLWLTAEECNKLIASEAQTAIKIGELIRQNQLEDAAAALKQALDVDPNDPAALYLNGLVLAEQEQTSQARKQFDAVNKLIPRHAPTLNNLGTLMCRQKLYPAALLAYAQAMQSSPVNRIILDNVAEALHAVPKDQHDSPPVIAAAKLFVEQDQLLQQKQAAKGLYRWGSTWVTAEQLKKLKAEEQSIQDRMSLLQSDYDTTRRGITADDATINQDAAAMLRIQQLQQVQINGQPPIGRPPVFAPGTAPYASGFPQEYYDYQAEVNRATANRQGLVQHLAELNNQANKLEQEVSVPLYSGVQRLIGQDGTPIRTGFGAPTTRASPG